VTTEQPADGMKRCAHCLTWHPITHFTTDARTADGLRASCKTCAREQRKKYRIKKQTAPALNHKYPQKYESEIRYIWETVGTSNFIWKSLEPTINHRTLGKLKSLGLVDNLGRLHHSAHCNVWKFTDTAVKDLILMYGTASKTAEYLALQCITDYKSHLLNSLNEAYKTQKTKYKLDRCQKLVTALMAEFGECPFKFKELSKRGIKMSTYDIASLKTLGYIEILRIEPKKVRVWRLVDNNGK